MSKTNQSIVLDPSETAQVLELQGLLNKDGMDRSISQVVDYALRVAMVNAKAAPNADFRDKGELWEASRPPQDSVAESHRDYLRSILLNLARGALTRQWTIFSGNNNAYSEGGLMHALEFTSRRRVQAILELLESRGELLKVTGKKYQKQGQANLYWATEKLRQRLI